MLVTDMNGSSVNFKDFVLHLKIIYLHCEKDIDGNLAMHVVCVV